MSRFREIAEAAKTVIALMTAGHGGIDVSKMIDDLTEQEAKEALAVAVGMQLGAIETYAWETGIPVDVILASYGIVVAETENQ